MSENTESWAVVELMGHVTIAGRVTKPGEYGGLWQIDIPTDDTFRTEFFGSQSVYRIRIVSEEISRAYALPSRAVIEYDAPIVTRAEHENAINHAREIIDDLRQQLRIANNYSLQNKGD
jgi:beta-phosphoglucomutase-like phosphatase (HAD superfamily)